MKVTKRGVLPNERTFVGTCNNCASEVEFQGAEAANQKRRIVQSLKIVQCPVCSYAIKVPYRDKYTTAV